MVSEGFLFLTIGEWHMTKVAKVALGYHTLYGQGSYQKDIFTIFFNDGSISEVREEPTNGIPCVCHYLFLDQIGVGARDLVAGSRAVIVGEDRWEKEQIEALNKLEKVWKAQRLTTPS